MLLQAALHQCAVLPLPDVLPGTPSAHGHATLPPQDFVWGREKLLGLRHLDQLLAAAPVHVHVAAAGSRPTSNARPPPASRPPPPHAATQLPSPALCTPGLHVHVVPRGRAVEAAAEELAGLAEALVKVGRKGGEGRTQTGAVVGRTWMCGVVYGWTRAPTWPTWVGQW